MQRRDFITSMIKSMAAAGAIAAVGRGAHATPQGWREFEITFRISIKDPTAPVRLWVPVPQDALDYQRVVDIGWRSPITSHVLWEGTSRAPIVSTAWPDLTTAREVEITARVMTRDRSGFYPDASREELAEYLRPTPSSPTDGIVPIRCAHWRPRRFQSSSWAWLARSTRVTASRTWRRQNTVRSSGSGDLLDRDCAIPAA